MMIAPSVYFFPYTDISPERAVAGLTLFTEIILYKSHFGQPEELAFLVEKGRLKFENASFFDNEKEFASILASFRELEAVYRDPESLAVLKSYQADEDVERSGVRLISAIRGGDADKPKRDAQKEAEVLLHFIGKLDRQEQEIGSLLSEAELKEADLGDIMGVDVDDELSDAEIPIPFSLVRPAAAPAAMMRQRLEAWARFYLEFGDEARPLLTDQPEALAAMDLNLARKMNISKELKSNRETDVIEHLFDMPFKAPQSIDELENPREFAKWFDFVNRLTARSWKTDELDGLREESQRLAAEYEAEYQCIDGPRYVVSGYLLPGGSLKQAFAVAAGLETFAKKIDQYCGPVFLIRSAD